MAAGSLSRRALADELNRRLVPTARGGRWHLTSVERCHDMRSAKRTVSQVIRAAVVQTLTQSYHPQDVFARLASWTWEGACDARTAGVPLSKASKAIGVTWVIDISVDCAFGAWTVLSAPSLVTAADCLLAGRLGVPSLLVLAF
jgi:hypothetical protein